MLNKNVESFIACGTSFNEAKIVLYGAPFDSTTSYRPGARFGSAAIRHESYGIETYSPYQDADLEGAPVFDSGDVELCFGDTALALRALEARAGCIVAAGKLPLLLGGEHLVTLAPVRVLARKHPNLHILHFDAHADLRDDYLGAKLSHACVMRRCYELLGDGRLHQFGIRSGEREEFAFGKAHTDFHSLSFDGLEATVNELAANAAPIYLTVDLDVLDPSGFPGTGTPEAGGVSFAQLRDALEMICRRCNVVGADLVELAPPLDASGISTAAACKLLREVLLALLKI